MVALVGTHLQKTHGVWLDISSPICDVLISGSPPCRSNYAMVSFIPPVIRHKHILFRRLGFKASSEDNKRLLNPNPETRYGIEELMNTLWFKKSS
ncbi:hypothetical protein CQW23_22539 [Capsicum baccatum]|uniref:Uncharacterized protein n=1 Tax=Capsicum baccatum TaxID=33114 RepID=A0A2G2W159_CAPBA|nr:hypothetical protein CQW23_22539 [Capsicum baccatum]